jgi:Ala-tRNA(Pro) deacylase
MSALERFRSYLDQEGVHYEVREHPEAYTAQEIAALEHVSGLRMAKVVMAFVDGRLVMLVLPAPYRLSPEKAAAAFGGKDARLAHEDEFAPSFPDCDAGAQPPFGNLYGLPVCVDRALAEDESIVVQAGTHRHTMEIAYADFERLVRPMVASLSESSSPA